VKFPGPEHPISIQRNQDKARNEIFNVSNGDVDRWRQLWKELATFYDLPIAEPLAMSAVSEMSEDSLFHVGNECLGEIPAGHSHGCEFFRTAVLLASSERAPEAASASSGLRDAPKTTNMQGWGTRLSFPLWLTGHNLAVTPISAFLVS
jgi:hypothetical protein